MVDKIHVYSWLQPFSYFSKYRSASVHTYDQLSAENTIIERNYCCRFGTFLSYLRLSKHEKVCRYKKSREYVLGDAY